MGYPPHMKLFFWTLALHQKLIIKSTIKFLRLILLSKFSDITFILFIKKGLPLKPCCPFLINKIKVISENLDNNISLKNFMVDFIINFLCNASEKRNTILL